MSNQERKTDRPAPNDDVIFRMTRRNPRTGKIERRADGKPWVIRIRK